MVTDKGKLHPRLNNPENIKIIAKLIDYCNKVGYIPSASDSRY